MKYRGTRRVMFFLTAAVLAGNLSIISLAAERRQDENIVRVAFPEVEGFSETDEEGNRSGIVYDFLAEIAKYTGWQYEFVDGSPEEMIKEVADGRIDVMGGVPYCPDLEEEVIYPEYSMGYNYSLIFLREDDEDIQVYDRRTMNGKTIGVYSRNLEQIERLKKYLVYHDLSCEFIYYDDIKKYRNCLEKKETDMMLGYDIDKREGYDVAGRFANEDNYLVVSRKREALLPELNKALENIYESNSGFAEELYIKYFSGIKKDSMYLSREEQAFISNCGSIRVAVLEDRFPLNYEYKGEERGIIRDIINLIAGRTGLTFEFVKGEDYQDILELVRNGEADIAGYFLGDNDVAKDMELVISQPYTETNEVVVINKGVEYPGNNLKIVIPKGKSEPAYIRADEITYAKDYSACIKEVNSGKADFTCMPFIFAEAVFHKENISNITVVPLNNRKISIAFALPRSAPKELYFTINKAVNNLPDDEIDRVIENNQLFMKQNYSAVSIFIHTHPGIFAGIVAVFIVLISAIVLVTWRYRMKQELMLAELRQAEAASEAKSEFLSRMSHNLRTPLNTIIGLVKLIRITGNEPPETEEKLEKIDISSQYLLSLLNNILDMSNIEKQKINIQIAPFRMDSLVRQLRYIMYFQAEEKGVYFECTSRLSHEVFLGDALKLKQSIMNLLANALKFTSSDGSVIFCVEELDNKHNKARLRFSVKDSGVGIKEEDRTKIFEVFEQASADGEDVEGSGLGLTISAHLVRLMGSKIEIDSTPGKGTEFSFVLELPIAKEEAEADAFSRLEMMHRKPEKGEFDGKVILLAEDNDLNAKIVISLLEHNGMIVTHADNGRKAVDMFMNHPEDYYDIILMDLQMPVMDGLKACEAIRHSGRKDAKTVPIAAMTANTLQEDREQAMKAGMNDFIAKPFEIGEVYGVFRKYMSKSMEKG